MGLIRSILGNLYGALTKAPARPRRQSVRLTPSARDLQVVQASAQRMADVVNESMQIAATSKNKATRLSRLGVARQNLKRLRTLKSKFPMIQMFSALEVELDIVRLEDEAMAMPDPPPKKLGKKKITS